MKTVRGIQSSAGTPAAPPHELQNWSVSVSKWFVVESPPELSASSPGHLWNRWAIHDGPRFHPHPWLRSNRALTWMGSIQSPTDQSSPLYPSLRLKVRRMSRLQGSTACPAPHHWWPRQGRICGRGPMNENKERLMDFCASNNWVTGGTIFTHKLTRSPYGKVSRVHGPDVWHDTTVEAPTCSIKALMRSISVTGKFWECTVTHSNPTLESLAVQSEERQGHILSPICFLTLNDWILNR